MKMPQYNHIIVDPKKRREKEKTKKKKNKKTQLAQEIQYQYVL